MSSKNYLDKNGLTYFWGKVQNEITPKANTSDVLTKTNTTSYIPSANYHPATKKYVDDKGFVDLSDIFIIECTTENNTPVVDKTWTEITTAYNAGKKIFAKYGSFIFQLLTFHPSSNSSQGYIGFHAPFGSFNPDSYFNQWRYEIDGIFIWDTTWSGEDGETRAWNTVYFEPFARATTEWTDPFDSNGSIIQRLINDSGNSIFMERYSPSGYSGFNFGTSTTLSTTYYNPSVTNNITLNSSGLSITSTAGVSIQNLVTPTNNTDAATKGYVDSATLSGLTDTTISSPANGQVLSYNSTSNKWVNADTPAIKAGTGTNSVIVGQTENDSNAVIYTLSLTGLANVRTYAYTTQDTLPSGSLLKASGFIEYSTGGQTYRSLIESVDTSNHTITLINSLDPYDAISSGTASIYYKYGNIANNSNSYAEGNKSRAYGSSAHAEGQGSLASGSSSHAEGYTTTASGGYSHAEGRGTYANGIASHAEGSYTRTIVENQHVQGKYNIEDTSGTYAHIVGNGTASTPSNAHTLDWNGNGWYAGKLTVGTAPTNNMDVATKQYVDTAVSGVTDTNTTYTISISGNVITLTPSTGTAQTITLPVYNGGVT